MAALALTRFAVLLAAGFLAGCAGGPGPSRAITIEAGRPTRVLLQQIQQRQTFLLQNASSTSAADFYRGDMPSLAKIAPDAQLQALLDILAGKGMFQDGGMLQHGQGNVPADARDVLAVEQGGRTWTWVRRQAGVQADEMAFHEARSYFLDLYNQSQAYHSSDRGLDLKAEQARVRREAEAAKAKLQQLQGDHR